MAVITVTVIITIIEITIVSSSWLSSSLEGNKKRVTIRRIKTQQHEWCHLFHPFPGQPAPPHPPSWLVLCIIATISVIINFNIAEPFTLYLSSSYSSKSSPILSRLSDRQTQLNSAPLHPNYFWPNDNISEKKTMNPNKKGVASCTHCCRHLRHFAASCVMRAIIFD